MNELRVKEEWETIKTIIQNHASVSRFGDGEIKVILGHNAVGQDTSSELSKRLRKILIEEVDNLLIGIPRVFGRFDLSWVNEKSATVHQELFSRRKVKILFNYKKQYYSTFMTRPDNAIHLDCKAYWDLCGQMWAGRNVIVIHGGGKPKLGLYTESKIFKNTESVSYIESIPRNAFSEYNRILEEVSIYPKDSLVYIALGVAGTVLAHDLHKLGYQALDMGHFGMFYGRAHLKTNNWECVKTCLNGINFKGQWLNRDDTK